ncbi:hypothetical protein WA158_002447 [Blastocystis sp. Blastoise]
MSFVYVLCRNCRHPTVEECKLDAKDVSIYGSNETVRIRTGKKVFACSVCNEYDMISIQECFCYKCNKYVSLQEITVCEECGAFAFEIEYLAHVSNNHDENAELGENQECMISCACTDCNWMIYLPCNHQCCLECFCDYLKNCCLDQSNIYFESEIDDFVINCFADCDYSYSIDLLRLTGERFWSNFSYRANCSRLIKAQGGYICPLTCCGGGITGLKPISEQPIIFCPFCKRFVCRHCNSEALNQVCPSLSTDELLKTSVRYCPKCHTPVTHYFGNGCHHIGIDGGCVGCRQRGEIFHWCYYCLKGGSEYPESCKKNHWWCKKDGCDICMPCPKCNENNKTGKPWKCDCR